MSLNNKDERNNPIGLEGHSGENQKNMEQNHGMMGSQLVSANTRGGVSEKPYREPERRPQHETIENAAECDASEVPQSNLSETSETRMLNASRPKFVRPQAPDHCDSIEHASRLSETGEPPPASLPSKEDDRSGLIAATRESNGETSRQVASVTPQLPFPISEITGGRSKINTLHHQSAVETTTGVRSSSRSTPKGEMLFKPSAHACFLQARSGTKQNPSSSSSSSSSDDETLPSRTYKRNHRMRGWGSCREKKWSRRNLQKHGEKQARIMVLDPSSYASSATQPGTIDAPRNSSNSVTDAGYGGGRESNDSGVQSSSCSSPTFSSRGGQRRGERMPEPPNSMSRCSSYSDMDDYSSDVSGEGGCSSESPDPFYSSCGGSDQSDVTSTFDARPFNSLSKFEAKMAAAARRKIQDFHKTSLRQNFKEALNLSDEGGAVGDQDDDEQDKKPAAQTSPYSEVTCRSPAYGLPNSQPANGCTPILDLSSDIMAQCLTFLEPPEIHRILTMPLCKAWRTNYAMPNEIWRILCLSEPFNAKMDSDEQDTSGDEGIASTPKNVDLEVKHLLGRYRLMYGSFVRCMNYLNRIKDDAANGRQPSVIDYGGGDLQSLSLRSTPSLKHFLARARGAVVKKKRKRDLEKKKSTSPDDLGVVHIGVTDVTSSGDSSQSLGTKKKKKRKVAKVKYGHSELTQRLLGPSKSGAAGNVNLPWSCAVYSIVNWMVAFSDVEGIQTMCLGVLPKLLEDESQRTAAQRAGITDIVLRGMVLFPNSVNLHTAAFHTLVLLARPLGGKEGMLFHSSMVNSSGIFNSGNTRALSSKVGGKQNGIAIMLDSMRRFETDEVLQAMSCWSLVNIALAPSQKAVLVKLGGISVVANAMMRHPYNAEVQFRALFALINLVIPSANSTEADSTSSNNTTNNDSGGEGGASSSLSNLGEVMNDLSEREMVDESVGQIANLVVVAMKNFCSSESILNRACLVLHNISLTAEYHETLLWTPNCYQMLEWCLANYRTDRVLQQSAGGTLHRLQSTLSHDEELRARFTVLIQSQNQSNLERVHREAMRLHEQQEQLLSRQQQQQRQQEPAGGRSRAEESSRSSRRGAGGNGSGSVSRTGRRRGGGSERRRERR